MTAAFRRAVDAWLAGMSGVELVKLKEKANVHDAADLEQRGAAAGGGKDKRKKQPAMLSWATDTPLPVYAPTGVGSPVHEFLTMVSEKGTGGNWKNRCRYVQRYCSP